MDLSGVWDVDIDYAVGSARHKLFLTANGNRITGSHAGWAFQGDLKGDIDAVTTDDVILAGYAAEQPDRLKLVGKPFSTERYGVGLHKGDARRAGVTEALRAMIGDGSWQKFVAGSVGRSGYQVPPRPQVVDSP